MCSTRCIRVMAILTLILAFCACGVSFLAPYWILHRTAGLKITTISYGLWARCGGVLSNIGDSFTDDLKRCHWFFENDFRWQKSLPDWWYACQGLSGFGMLFFIMTLPTGCGALCCCSHGLSYFTGSMLLFASTLQGAALGVWGYFAHKDYEVTPFVFGESEGYMNWGYYVGIVGVVLGILSGLLFLCSQRGYSYHKVPTRA